MDTASLVRDSQTQLSLLDTAEWATFNFGIHPELKSAQERILNWYNDLWGMDTGRALILAGGCGCGKTHLALSIHRLYIEGGAVFFSEPEMIAGIRTSYNGKSQQENTIVNAARRAHLLILDDVGASRVKEENLDWIQDIYWRIFNHRVLSQLPTLITTNLDLAALAERLGERAASRLMEMLGGEENYISLFNVPDYRLNKFSRRQGRAK